MAAEPAETYDDDPETAAAGAERLNFFSDAVVAIAMTLLALELPVPEGRTPAEFWTGFAENSGDYLAFLLGFLVIALHWRNHHRMMVYLRRSDSTLRLLDLLWLLTIVLMPFATKLLADGPPPDVEDSSRGARFALYAALQVLSYVLFVLMVRQMSRHGLARGMPPGLVTASERSVLLIAGGFAVSVPLFFVTHWAWICWAVGILLQGFWLRLTQRRHQVP
ncbi:DUF1211 domain-containing protein [Nakamurella sp. YIM 132087]|uniref:DUF1211 domain-containing protein n=1 Tax=Nakamurella alba TaxID=2665158 RepID=A0A7K1FS83_9ACTN|nr:TMEM175 family protein [Nakamurella alba]MTD16998.1 DUF1211 domain-containing protein [Nakamurella alba]